MKLQYMRLRYKANAIRFRDGPGQPFLAYACGEMLTVMYRYLLKCPLKSIVSRCESILPFRIREYFVYVSIYIRASGVVRKFPLTRDVSGVPLHVVHGVSPDYSQS